MNDERERLAAAVRETVPRAPGVYAFTDARGRLLYVGKSVSLRQRMSSYFRTDHLDAEPHLGRLVARIRSFDWWQTRSELLALLLEDVLIKELLPPMNTRQREFAENRYLELTDDEFPTCLVVEHTADFGARDVHGPMKDRHFAAGLRDIIHGTIGVRTCNEPTPSRRCLEFDIGRCSGPCRGALEPGEYGELVEEARAFLRGGVEPVLGKLVDARDRAAAAQSYEEAARLRDAVDTCRHFGEHQRFAQRFAEGSCTVSCAAGGIEHRFSRGALLAPRVVVAARGRGPRRPASEMSGFHAESAGRRAVAALHGPPPADRRFLADRSRIVCNWVRNAGRECVVSFDYE
jgi:excinuclease ABC subunit C